VPPLTLSVPLNTWQVILETSFSRQLTALILTTKLTNIGGSLYPQCANNFIEFTLQKECSVPVVKLAPWIWHASQIHNMVSIPCAADTVSKNDTTVLQIHVQQINVFKFQCKILCSLTYTDYQKVSVSHQFEYFMWKKNRKILINDTK